MRLLYLDCSSGVSGDMLLAALTGALEETAGPDGAELLATTLGRAGVDGFALTWSRPRVGGVVTRRVDVAQTSAQPLRTYAKLVEIVRAGALSSATEARALAALTLLGRAEAKVHGVALEAVHFHEIGAVDTLVDIVGAMVLMEALGVEAVAASPVDLGSGFVVCAHGRMPVPAPACAELARGLTVFGSDCGMERATPTGLAVLRAVVSDCGPLPPGRVCGVGYGSGSRSSDEQPTYVRAFVLETVADGTPSHDHNHPHRHV